VALDEDEANLPAERGGRIRFSPVDPRVRSAWIVILKHLQELRQGRRDSWSDRSPLWEKLVGAHEECYGKDGGTPSPYSDFVANNVKELPADSPIVSLVHELPPPIAEAISDPKRMMKVLTAEDKIKFDSLQVRYNHCGGPAGEWERYLNLDSAADLWWMGFEEDVVANVAVLAVG
jgi:hypothetical protein